MGQGQSHYKLYVAQKFLAQLIIHGLSLQHVMYGNLYCLTIQRGDQLYRCTIACPEMSIDVPHRCNNSPGPVLYFRNKTRHCKISDLYKNIDYLTMK